MDILNNINIDGKGDSIKYKPHDDVVINPQSEEVFIPCPITDEFFHRAMALNLGFNPDVWRWCPATISDWLIGEKYLNLSNVIRPAVFDDVCEFFKIQDGETDPWKRLYDEAAFCEGIGSGKSFKTSLIATYFQHLLLCLREPQLFFEIDKSSKIAIMNMSVSEKNATKVIFSEIKSKIENCKWFNERPWDRPDSRMPDPNVKSELKFKNNTFIIPGSSHWRTAVGYNIIVGIIDEAGSYRKTDNSDQADDIYHTLQRRLGSRFEERGAIIMAGSPMYEQDFLEMKLNEGEVVGSRTLSRRRNLWDAKYPNWAGDYFFVDRVNRVVIDEAMSNRIRLLTDAEREKDYPDVDKIPHVPFLFKAFRANVTKAYRDYGARPSAAINAYFEAPKVLIDRINTSRHLNPLNIDGSFADWFRPIDRSVFHTVHVDLALSGDACGLALGHYNGMTEEGGIKVYIDLMMRLQGSTESPIQISKVRDYIYALTNLGFNIGLITYDGFQSSDSIQILEKKGYTAELLSVDRTMLPYSNFKEAINEGRVDYYCISPEGVPLRERLCLDNDELTPSEVFVKEAMRLEEIEGKKVDHPPKGSKDVCDAVCGVVHNIISGGVAGYFGTLQAKIV